MGTNSNTGRQPKGSNRGGGEQRQISNPAFARLYPALARKMSCDKSPAKALLAELKKGQHALWKTIENLKPSEERMAETQTALVKRKLDRISRDSLTVAIDGVDKVPRKRARLRQLSPEYEVSV